MKKILLLTIVFLSSWLAAHAQVTQAEYFIDTDPGQGSATALIAEDGNFDNILETAIQTGISVSDVGFHSINVRVKDINGNWGPVFKTILHVENLLSVRAIKIAQAEMFIDTDPGQGSGIPMVAFDGNFSDALESVLNTTTGAPSLGLHKICVRVKDMANTWGPVFTTVLKVDNLLTSRNIKVAAAELFWDTDPGQGNGIAMLAFDGNYTDAIESALNNTVSTPSLGFHKLNVRVKDFANTWGPLFTTVVHIENVFSSRAIKIAAGELFWDTDPGQGSGITMLAFDGNFTDALESALNNTITTPATGMHKLNVRVKDVANNWGPVFTTIVDVELPYTLRNIKITAGEMFFDTDPGQGSGITMIAFDGNFNNAIETISQDWAFLPNPGYHTLNVRAKDVAGVWSPVFTTAIHFLPCISQPVPTVSSAGNITNICPGDSVLLTASGAYTSYTWFRGSTQVGTGQTYYANAAGFYQVYVTDGSGCPGYSTFLQITETPVIANITTGGPTTFCQGGSVTLDAGSGYATYNWSGGQSSQTINVTASGVFTVTVSNGSCAVTSAPVSVTVNPIPAVPVISASGATNFCMGQNVTLTSSAANSYFWSTGAVTQGITVNQTGNYSVTAYNSFNCSAVSSVTTVTVDDPIANISASGPTTFCQGDSVILSVNSNSSYVWSNTLTSQSINVNQSGTYSVVITDALGCADSSQISVTVNPNPATPVITLNAGDLVSSSPTGNQWYLNGNLLPGATGQTYTFTQNGIYTVVVTNANGCSVSSASLNMTSIGIEIMQGENGINIYPNPFTSQTIVSFTEEQKNITVKIADVLGKEVQSFNFSGKSLLIGRGGLNAGIYFIQIYSENKNVINRKIVIQ